MTNQKKIIVGLSGGVDSSVSAWLLQQKGYEVQGLFMKNWERDDYHSLCTTAKDLADVRLVCDKLGIVLHTANFSEEYWEHVFKHFLEEYQAYRTPNPDILCNKMIKFKVFLEYAQQLGADTIATGHYAGNRYINGQYELYQGVDRSKDQTYFLYTLNQSQLAHTLFPLTEFKKTKVRQIATEIGLPNHAKKDSVGICFIGKRNFKDFLKKYIQPNPGPIKTLDGQLVGQHQGLMYYTLGQRQGLQIGGHRNYKEAPWYVVAKEPSTNTLRVAQGNQHPSLYTQTLYCHEMHWTSDSSPRFPLHCHAKIRYRQLATPCAINQENANTYCVNFEQSQRAITPGQAIVFYQDSLCLGGGTILESNI